MPGNDDQTCHIFQKSMQRKLDYAKLLPREINCENTELAKKQNKDELKVPSLKEQLQDTLLQIQCLEAMRCAVPPKLRAALRYLYHKVYNNV